MEKSDRLIRNQSDFIEPCETFAWMSDGEVVASEAYR